MCAGICQCSAGIQGYGSLALVLSVHFETEEKGLGSQFITKELLRSVWRCTLGFRKKKTNINRNPTSLLPPPREKPQSPPPEKAAQGEAGTGVRL